MASLSDRMAQFNKKEPVSSMAAKFGPKVGSKNGTKPTDPKAAPNKPVDPPKPVQKSVQPAVQNPKPNEPAKPAEPQKTIQPNGKSAEAALKNHQPTANALPKPGESTSVKPTDKPADQKVVDQAKVNNTENKSTSGAAKTEGQAKPATEPAKKVEQVQKPAEPSKPMEAPKPAEPPKPAATPVPQLQQVPKAAEQNKTLAEPKQNIEATKPVVSQSPTTTSVVQLVTKPTTQQVQVQAKVQAQPQVVAVSTSVAKPITTTPSMVVTRDQTAPAQKTITVSAKANVEVKSETTKPGVPQTAQNITATAPNIQQPTQTTAPIKATETVKNKAPGEELFANVFYFNGMGNLIGSALSEGIYVPEKYQTSALEQEEIEKLKEKGNTHEVVTKARGQAQGLYGDFQKLQSLLEGLPTFTDTLEPQRIERRGVDQPIHGHIYFQQDQSLGPKAQESSVHKHTVVSNKIIQPSINRPTSHESVRVYQDDRSSHDNRPRQQQVGHTGVTHVNQHTIKHTSAIDPSSIKPWQMSHARALEVHGFQISGDPHQPVNQSSNQFTPSRPQQNSHHGKGEGDLPYCDL